LFRKDRRSAWAWNQRLRGHSSSRAGSGAFAEGKHIKGGAQDARLPYDYAKAGAEASSPVAPTNRGTERTIDRWRVGAQIHPQKNQAL
jgi:hypothetical protein